MGKGGRRGSEGSVTMEERSEGGCPAVQEGEDRPQAKEGRWPPASEKATEVDSPLESSPVRSVGLLTLKLQVSKSYVVFSH